MLCIEVSVTCCDDEVVNDEDHDYHHHRHDRHDQVMHDDQIHHGSVLVIGKEEEEGAHGVNR